ncbi:hypothetical protein ACH5RR_038148 [Cinchona calisaya]|uniref:F-box domain-containing protein n=1 Tax=Cinchona calisaya TaxID=153742 RepID=A0ABD2Y882_9GENT
MEINGRVNCCGTNVKKLSKRRRLAKCTSLCLTTDVLSFKDNYLPDWFFMEILSGLPIKLVFSLKYVTRQWLSLISYPSFAHFYVSRAPTSALSAPRSPWEAKGKKYVIKAVENGFVLYSWFECKRNICNGIVEYYICDPITKRWFPLPEPKYGSRYVDVGFTTQVEARILTSYKVVLIHCPQRKLHFLEFEVFSSKTGEWVEHTVHFEYAIQVSCRKYPFVLHGNLHWNDCEFGIIAYDPYNCPDKFQVIRYPADVDKRSLGYVTRNSICGVHQGRLKYFEVTNPNGYDFTF